MNERWPDIEAIVNRVLAADPIRRPTIIADACKEDASLQAEVESLLDACEAAGGFLEKPALAFSTSQSLKGELLPTSPMPERIGEFRILRVLGMGGMGVVYVAEQDRPHRAVALKVIRPGLATPSILRRFEHEAEVLARLQHPGIAQVYEAGMADTGYGPQPFFAMELVQGHSITDFVVAQQLGTRERIELLARVADAVHHAHQKGVIHRDLKPGNILVDATGQPKILDFGVARLTSDDAQLITLHTDAGQLIGTLAYMSPEQATGDPAGVDIRSDVYALGVIAYELLADKLPFNLNNCPLHEGVRVVLEDDPAPLSSIHRSLRGDIETIVAKALIKDKEHRYQSALELAADLRRFLADEPILARPPSTWYQLTTFVRRNRPQVAAAALVLLVLVAATVTLAVQNSRLIVARDGAVASANAESEQRKVALAETAKVREALATIQGMFRTGEEGGGRDVRVIDLLDQFAARFPEGSTGDPELMAFREHVMGAAYRRLGEVEEARSHLERALAVRKALIPVRPRDLLDTQFELAQLQVDAGEASVLPIAFSDLDSAASSTLSPGDPLLLAIRARLAWAELASGDHSAAKESAGALLTQCSAYLDSSDPTLLDAMRTLVLAMMGAGESDAAIRLLGDRIAMVPSTEVAPLQGISLKAQLADCLTRVGRPAEAISLLTGVLPDDRASVPESPLFVDVLLALARALERDGHRDESRERYLQSQWMSMKLNGEFHPVTLRIDAEYARFGLEDPALTPEVAKLVASFVQRAIDGAVLRRSRFHPDILRLRVLCARALTAAGEQEKADQQFRASYFDTLERFGPDAPETVDALMWRAFFLVERDNGSASAVSLPDLLVYFQKTFGPDFPETLFIQFHCGWAKARYDAADAERLMVGAFQGLMKTVGPDNERTIRVADGLATFYEQSGRTNAATAMRQAGSASPTGERPLLTPDDVRSLRVTTLLRRAERGAAAGDDSSAVEQLSAAVQILEGDTSPPDADREQMLLDVLGTRAWSLNKVGRVTDALADAERSFALSKAVALERPSVRSTRQEALRLTDVAVYRSRAGMPEESRDAFRMAMSHLKALADAAPPDEHTWRGILDAGSFQASLCALQAKRADLRGEVRSDWAQEGIETAQAAEDAFIHLRDMGAATSFDDICRSTAINSADVCRGIMGDLQLPTHP